MPPRWKKRSDDTATLHKYRRLGGIKKAPSPYRLEAFFTADLLEGHNEVLETETRVVF